MTKKEFLQLIQSEAFKLSIRDAIEPFREEMLEFRDQVLTREDATCKELRAMRDELASFSNRITRVEEYAGLSPQLQMR